MKSIGIMNKLPNGVSSKIGRSGLVARKHSPVILFGAGIVGMVTTAVMASRATLKAQEVLEEPVEMIEKIKQAREQTDRDQYSEKDEKKDLTIAYSKMAIGVIKLYGPAVIVGMASVAALTGSHVILNRRNVALTAAYKVIEKGFQEYRERVAEEVGEEKERDIYHGMKEVEVTEQLADGTEKKRTIKVPTKASMYSVFFDESNPNWNRNTAYNRAFIQGQQQWANDLLQGRGYVFLNDVYEMLGFERTPAGQLVGWLKGSEEGDDYVDFGIFRDNHAGMQFVIGSEPAVLLDFNVDGIIYDKI